MKITPFEIITFKLQTLKLMLIYCSLTVKINVSMISERRRKRERSGGDFTLGRSGSS